jgi:cytochrome c-type biogenesis protein CcmH/NrfG
LNPAERSYLLSMASQGLFEPDIAYHRQELERYLAAHPKDSEAWYLIAATEERLPRTPAALADALKAGERARAGLPGDLRVARLLGELYLSANQPAKALSAYREGLASSPRSNEMLHGIAICEARLGRMGSQ